MFEKIKFIMDRQNIYILVVMSMCMGLVKCCDDNISIKFLYKEVGIQSRSIVMRITHFDWWMYRDGARVCAFGTSSYTLHLGLKWCTWVDIHDMRFWESAFYERGTSIVAALMRLGESELHVESLCHGQKKELAVMHGFVYKWMFLEV